VEDATKIAKIGDNLKFRVVSIEPNEHRLGLSLREEHKEEEKTKEKETATE
jgi:predicted RNA-binding protein with RPS1 domain